MTALYFFFKPVISVTLPGALSGPGCYFPVNELDFCAVTKREIESITYISKILKMHKVRNTG